jgi:DNA-binding response OmpR family regulator
MVKAPPQGVRGGGGREDVLVTDLIMPGENGLDLCRTLRSAHFVRPILAISGDPLQLDDALGAGATACLPKPFTIDDFLNAIRRATSHEVGQSGCYGLEGSPLMPDVYLAEPNPCVSGAL